MVNTGNWQLEMGLKQTRVKTAGNIGVAGVYSEQSESIPDPQAHSEPNYIQADRVQLHKKMHKVHRWQKIYTSGLREDPIISSYAKSHPRPREVFTHKSVATSADARNHPTVQVRHKKLAQSEDYPIVWLRDSTHSGVGDHSMKMAMGGTGGNTRRNGFN
jgi:hypothetical protein